MRSSNCLQSVLYVYMYVERTHTYTIVANLHFFAQYNVDNTETERDAGSKADCAKSSQKQKWKQVERETTFRFVLAVFHGGGRGYFSKLFLT